MARLHAKCLTMSHTQFGLDVCLQRWRTHPINKITCVLLLETVVIVVLLTDTLMWVYNQQISDCCRPVLTQNWSTDFWLTDYRLTPSVTDRVLIMYSIFRWHLFLCYSSCVQSVLGLFIWLMWRFFACKLNNVYFTRQIF